MQWITAHIYTHNLMYSCIIIHTYKIRCLYELSSLAEGDYNCVVVEGIILHSYANLIFTIYFAIVSQHKSGKLLF